MSRADRRRRMRIIRRKIGGAILPYVAPTILRVLSRTWKVERLGVENYDAVKSGRGWMGALWHGRMLVPLPEHRDQGLKGHGQRRPQFGQDRLPDVGCSRLIDGPRNVAPNTPVRIVRICHRLPRSPVDEDWQKSDGLPLLMRIRRSAGRDQHVKQLVAVKTLQLSAVVTVRVGSTEQEFNQPARRQQFEKQVDFAKNAVRLGGNLLYLPIDKLIEGNAGRYSGQTNDRSRGTDSQSSGGQAGARDNAEDSRERRTRQ